MKWRNVLVALQILAALVCGSLLGVQDVLAGLRRWQATDELTPKRKPETAQPILEVEFQHDPVKSPALRIKRASLKYGYAPQYEPVNSGYVLSLLSDQGDVLYSLTFAIPDKMHQPPQTEFSLTVPVITGAAKLQLRDPQQTIISSSR